MGQLTIEAGGSWLSQDDKFCDWLAELGVRPQDVYKVDIDFDADEMTVYKYALMDGKKFIQKDKDAPDYGEAAKEKPYKVDLSETSIPGVIRDEARRVGKLEEAMRAQKIAQEESDVGPSLGGPWMEAEGSEE